MADERQVEQALVEVLRSFGVDINLIQGIPNVVAAQYVPAEYWPKRWRQMKITPVVIDLQKMAHDLAERIR